MARRTKNEIPYAMGIADKTKHDILKRLARIRGQVEGIQRMVEDERYCPDILQQFAAVHSALRGAEKELLANHLERCAAHAIAEGGEASADVRQELLDLLYRYVR
ncbi:MAG: metal-sensitive transcriptional regulator [Gemmatimonadota bacterium]